VEDSDRPDGCVARRRTSYYNEVAAKGDLRSRLAMTNVYGLPSDSARVVGAA
jgi:RNA polymerase sigma factor for flagellar operon FliA